MKTINDYKTDLFAAIKQGKWIMFGEILRDLSNTNPAYIDFNNIEVFNEIFNYFELHQPTNINDLFTVYKLVPNKGFIKTYLDEIYNKTIKSNFSLYSDLLRLIDFDFIPNEGTIDLIEKEIKKGSNDVLLWDVLALQSRKKLLKYSNKIPNEATEAWQIFREEMHVNAIKNPFIDSVSIQNFHCISDVALSSIGNCKEIYFLGENGVGKTLLLQSIVMGSKFETSERLLFTARQLADKATIKCTFNPTNLINQTSIFAYGVSRLRHHDSAVDETGYGTLFDRQTVNLKNPITFLKEIERLEIKKFGTVSLENVIAMMNDVLNIESEREIQIILEDPDFVIYERKTKVIFDHLADGYRSILLLLVDLLSRLITAQPDIHHLADFRAVVLIDEVDMLLHPKWAYCIVQKLLNKFPNIQWMFSTHSPALIMGATKDAVFYRLYKEEGKTKISQQYTFDQIGNLLSNSIITSPLFGMDYSGMREQLADDSIDVDTSDDYLSSRIHRQIRQRIAEQKATNSSSYISDELINKWIAEALAEGGE